jgi:predicted RNA-binding protein YlxR (DUF448 family)
MRRCIVSGEILDKDKLVRFAISPDGLVVPDLAGKLPGRGLWVRADRAALNEAIQKKAFARAARRQVTVPDNLADNVAAQTRQRLIDSIGFARRSGFAVCGFEKVETLARRGSLAAVMIASDSGKDGRKKLEALASSAYFIDVLDSGALTGIFGTIGIVVYAGISDKAHAARLDAAGF